MCQFSMNFSGPKEAPEVKELGQESHGLPTRVGAAPWAGGGAPLSRGQPKGPLTCALRQNIL